MYYYLLETDAEDAKLCRSKRKGHWPDARLIEMLRSPSLKVFCTHMRVDLFGEWGGILFIQSLSKSRIRAERGGTADDRDTTHTTRPVV